MDFVQLEVSTDELLSRIGRLSIENDKLGEANRHLAGELGRVVALLEKHGVDPTEMP